MSMYAQVYIRIYVSQCNFHCVYRQPESSRSNTHDVSKFTGTLTFPPTPNPKKAKKMGFVTSCLGAALGTILEHTTPYYTILYYYTIQHYTTLYYTIHYTPILYYTIR